MADNRTEVGIAYRDLPSPTFAGPLLFSGSTTDATHTITLTADGANRHYGLPAQGVVIDRGGLANPAIDVQDDFVTVEWMQIQNGAGVPQADGIAVNNIGTGGLSQVVLRNNLIHNMGGCGIGLWDPNGQVDVHNNIVYSSKCGVWIEPTILTAGSRLRVLNNTLYGNTNEGVGKATPGASTARGLLLRNNIAANNGLCEYDVLNSGCAPGNPLAAGEPLDLASSNNLSAPDATGATHSPAGGGVTSTVVNVRFVNAAGGDFHILAGSTAAHVGADLSGVFATDIDAGVRQVAWDIGADELTSTALFRSVGITATALASGAANALTISGSTATFGSGLPTNIGVGDVIQYDSDGNSSIDALAFIHGKNISDTVYTVKHCQRGALPRLAGGRYIRSMSTEPTPHWPTGKRRLKTQIFPNQ